MQEIALDCGYPASSLKERVYAYASAAGSMVDCCGLLIYTASAGAQGTLGGLVSIAPRFSEILTAALRRVEICSNDPICADHEPDGYSGDRATHGAACHSCLLVAETSCEARNLFLDRALLVETMSEGGAQFFADNRVRRYPVRAGPHAPPTASWTPADNALKHGGAAPTSGSETTGAP
jgi:Domain of unknown function (DUF1998)